MMASRGMGIINPSKMPSGKRKARRDDTDFTEYAEGGEVETKAKAKPTFTHEVVDTRTGQVMGQYQSGKTARAGADRLDNKFGAVRYQARPIAAGGGGGAGNLDERGFASGGEAKSKVNEAGNYTKPGMRKSLFEKIKGQAPQGTAAGQWSARKAQLLAKQYKAKGGGYRD
jgi:hypothetical protein